MPMFLLGWYPDYFDTDDYISPFLAISGAKSEGSFYNNSQVDQWVRDEASTSDPAIRADRFAKIQAALVEDVPYIPLWSGAAQVTYVNGVQNVELHPVSYKWFIVNKPGATVLNASTRTTSSVWIRRAHMTSCLSKSSTRSSTPFWCTTRRPPPCCRDWQPRCLRSRTAGSRPTGRTTPST